jgi:hypothetical protein
LRCRSTTGYPLASLQEAGQQRGHHIRFGSFFNLFLDILAGVAGPVAWRFFFSPRRAK